MLSVRPVACRPSIAHWEPTPDLAHTDTVGLDKPALSGPPNPQSSWRDFGDIFTFIFCLTAFCLFIENSSLRF